MRNISKFILIILMFSIVLIAGCNTVNRNTNLIDINDIESIKIKTLPSPPKVKVINKTEDIKKVLSFINSLTLTESNQDNINGWELMVEFKGKNNHTVSFINNKVNFDGKWYIVGKEEITRLRTIYDELNYNEEQL